MRLCSIASGSSGNCIYVGSDTTHLLVDVGISGKRTVAGLNELGLDGKMVDGILVTHEHTDHIAGIGVLSRKYGLPIYGTGRTLEALQRTKSVGDLSSSEFHEIYADERFTIKDITVNPMKISHDAADPVAYRFIHDGKRIGVCTDLGTYNQYTVESLQGMDALFLEANHDINMLQVGPYPYYLKQRILGERGHLSNELSGRLLGELLHDKLKTIFLGHLSKENNMAELAYETVRLEVANGNNPYSANDFKIQVANRCDMSVVVEV